MGNGIDNLSCKEVYVPGEDSVSCRSRFIYNVEKDNSGIYNIACFDRSYGAPDNWGWDFGYDNKTSDEADPTYTFKNAGYYLVKLDIENSETKCKHGDYQLLNVGKEDGFRAVINFSQQAPTLQKSGGYPTDFVGTVVGVPAKVEWDFGDGSQDSTSFTPTHTYDQPGDYEVCVEVSDPITGETFTQCDTITIAGSTNVSKVIGVDAAMLAYPNPSGGLTTIAYSLEQATAVKLSVYDVLGNQITVLYDGSSQAGEFNLQWDASALAQGIYYLKLETSSGTLTNKLQIIHQ